MTNETNNLKNIVRFGDDNDDANDNTTSRAPRAIDTIIDIVLAGGFQLTADTAHFSKDVLHQAMLHGLKQKLVDSVAGKQGVEASAALNATYEMLVGGDWTRAREAGTGSNTTLLIEAMMRVFDQTREACIKVIDGTADDGKELASHPRIKPVILTIRAERAAAKAQQAVGAVGDDAEAFNPFA